MTNVVIIGAGGHGREVADIVADQIRYGADIDLLGFVDDDPTRHGQSLDGVPVLGDWTWFTTTDRRDLAVICAIGSPRICQRLVQRARDSALNFISAISPGAHISPHAHISAGVTVFPGAIINAGTRLDTHVIVNVGATVSHDTTVGCYTNINPGAHLAGNVTVGCGCYVGMGSNVIQGRCIGDWTVVGAGAIVIRDLPARVTAVGIPATVIKTHDTAEGSNEQQARTSRKLSAI